MTQYPRTVRNLGASRPSRGWLWPCRKAAHALLQSLAAAALPAHQAAATPVVKIAVVGPSTGPQAATTKALEEGARATAHRLGDGPRLLMGGYDFGKTAPAAFELSLKDDGCDGAKAEAVAKEIVAENVDLVLGHPCPKAALAAAKVYAAAGITFMATQTRHPDLTAKRAGPSIFRLCGRDDAQGQDAARYLLTSRRFKTIAIVHDRTLYAKTIAEQAEAAMKAAKQDTITATIIAGDKDYTKLIGKIKNADAVFFAGFPMEAGFILRELRAAGSTVPFLATDSVATQEFTASFDDIAAHASMLSPSADAAAAGAATAVLVFNTARAWTMGPHRDRAMERSSINATLASAKAIVSDGMASLDPTILKPPRDIAFDAAGNANVLSFRITRWSNGGWREGFILDEP